MKTGATLLLLEFLALWASLTMVSADLGICTLPPDGGLCFTLEERWYYDYEKKKCLPFSWGGCGGNENNFENRLDCESSCSRYGTETSRACPGCEPSEWPRPFGALFEPCLEAAQKAHWGADHHLFCARLTGMLDRTQRLGRKAEKKGEQEQNATPGTGQHLLVRLDFAFVPPQ